MNLDKRYDEVIELGSSLTYGLSQTNIFMLEFLFMCIFGVTLIFSIFLGMIYFDDRKDKTARKLLLLTLSVCALSFTFDLFISNVEDDVDKWKSEDVANLIKELPVEKHDVVYAKMDESFWGVDGDLYYSKEVEDDEFVSMKLSINVDGRLVTMNESFDTRMTLEAGKEPYLEYKHLKKDLGNGIYEGFYDAVLYLPKDYKFTDIK